MMYLLNGKLKAKPGLGAELATILLEASRQVSREKGCRVYVVGKAEGDPDAVYIIEIWDSREDHDLSLQDAAVKDLITRAIPLLDGMPSKGHELEILGGFGI